MLVNIVFSVRFRQPLRDPWVFFRLRQGFQDSLHTICCGAHAGIPGPDASCACRRGLGQELSHDPEVVRRHQKPSHPFILRLPVPAIGQECADIGLVLVGDAIGDFEFYAKAMQEFLTGPINAEISTIYSVDLLGNRSEILLNEREGESSLTLIAVDDVLQDRPAVESLDIVLESPLRLFHGGKLVSSFDFSLFSRSLLRRISSLAAYYCGSSLELDYRSISKSAGGISCFPAAIDEFEIPRTRMNGLIGSLTVTGVLDDLYPILRLGELVHVGKGAPFGFGAFRITSTG